MTNDSLSKIDFGAFPEEPVYWGEAEIVAVGSALFVPSLLSGGLFIGAEVRAVRLAEEANV